MAVRFEASSSGVGYLGRPAQVTGQPFTRIASFYFDNDDASNTLWNFDGEDLNEEWEYVEARSTNILRINALGGTSDSASGVWTDATWHRFALVYSGNTRTVYRLDGGIVQLVQRTNAEQFDIADESLLGLWNEGGASGRAVAQEKVWAAAFTVEELAHETQQFAPVRTANLVGWAKLLTHTDLSDEIGDSYTALGETSPSTVAGPSGIVEEWEGPRVASSATTNATSSSGGLSINLPSGIATGDLLLAFSANDTSVSWSASAGWEKIDDGANGSAVQGACWARIATGSDALTITGEANDIAVVTLRIPAAQHGVTDVTAIAKGTAATGSSSAPNGPNCNPGTSGKYLWLTYYAADDDDNTAIWWPVEGAPVAQVESAQSSSSCMVGVAYRWLEASSYDPSAFAMSASEEWRAQTFAIPPYSGPTEIDPSGIASSATYGSVTISNVSAQTISSSSLSSNAAFGSVTVAKVTVKNISMSGLGSNALYGTTLFANVTAKAIAPNGLASSVALGTSAINKVPAKSITPAGLTSNIVFGSSVLAKVLARTLALDSIASPSAHGATTISNVPSKEIEPSGLSSSVVFGSAALLNATPKDISFSGLVSNVSFGTALVAKATPKSITASGIVSATVVGDAVIGKASPKNISPNGIASSIDFGLTDLAGISIQTITVSSIPSVATVGTQTVSKNAAKNVAIDGIVSSAVVGTHTITKINAQNISPDGITTNIQFGATFVDDGSGDIPDSSLRPLYRIAVSLGFDRR